MPVSTTSDNAQDWTSEYHSSTPGSSVQRATLLGSQIQLPPSPAESDGGLQQAENSSATMREEMRILRDIDRGAPGDPTIPEEKTPGQRELAKKRSHYFENSFAQREPNSSARDRVMREAMVLADIRTNVIIHDEYTFITDLSSTLSSRYQRPEDSILVTMAHSCCLLFGGNFEPAYVLTISALPSQLQPVTNKRNATLLAKAMQEGLGVSPERGIIKFAPISEDNFASNGKTVTSKIEEMERELSCHGSSQGRSLSRATERTGHGTQSMRSLRGRKTSQLATHIETSPTPPTSAEFQSPPFPPPPLPKKSMNDLRAEKVRKLGRRKSIIASLFGKGN